MAFQDYTQSARARFHLGHVKPQVLIGIAALAAALLIILLVGMRSFGGDQAPLLVEAEAIELADQEEPEESAETASVYVHIGGCVATPGVYQLAEGARVSDAVAAAGGLTADAAGESINLARAVQDGEQVIVPSLQEVAAAGEQSAQLAASEGQLAQAAAASGAASSADAGKVNINTADSAQLQTLSGVGESKAQKIIAYREQNGPFKSVDDLLNVSGIGEKTLDALRESICV